MVQPGNQAPVRHQPAGKFLVDHFMDPSDKRTHLERITPILDGTAYAYAPGSERGFVEQPLQTYNGGGAVIVDQIPAVEAEVGPFGDVVFEDAETPGEVDGSFEGSLVEHA